MNKKGSLVNVGLGMTLGAHITPISRNFIEKADVVFVAASNNLVEEWVKTMNKDVRSLQPYYNEGTSRMVTYKKWVELIMIEVRAGNKVCGAFYGHPGVFAWSPHKSIEQARQEGYKAHMEPGISAEDCLYADLGINPATSGCTHHETSHFLNNNKLIDNTTYLVLWQLDALSNKTLSKFSSGVNNISLLVDKLFENYPKNHEIYLYECAVLAIDEVLIQKIKIANLIDTNISMKTTVVIPPVLKNSIY